MKNIVLILGMLLAIVSTSFSQDLGDYKATIPYNEKGVNDDGIAYFIDQEENHFVVYFVDDDGYITEYKTIFYKFSDFKILIAALDEEGWERVEANDNKYFVKNGMAVRYYKASYGYVFQKFYI